MANQIVVTGAGNVQVQISRAAVNNVAGVTSIIAGTNITVSPTNGIGDVTISATANVSSDRISNGTSNVSIPTLNGNVQVYATNKHWEFGTDGNVVLPNGGILGNPYGDAGNIAELQAGPNGYAGINNSNQEQYIIVDDNGAYVGVGYGTANNKQWTFGTDGNLSVPGNIVPGANITYDLGSTTNRFKDIWLANSTIYLGSQTISANATNTNISGVITGNGSGLTNLNAGNISGNVANANYANFAGTAYSVSGSNVSGAVANATYADNAGNANIANTAYSVSLANVSGAGNIASVNLDGNVSNLLTGNGTFVAIPTGGGNTDNISNGTSNVSIPVTNGNIEIYSNTEHWTFANTGNLILANGNGVIQSIANSSLDILNPNVSTMVLTPDQGYTPQALVLDPTLNGHIHLRAPGSNIDQPIANLYLGGEISSFEVGQFDGAVPNLYIHSNNNTWTFDINGNLVLPGNTFAVNYANGTQVPLDGPVANANYANFAGQVVDNTQSNITSVGTLSNLTVSGNVSAPTVYSQGMVTQGYDFVQMQYSNGVALPVSPYDIGTGSWFYLDAGGATWQSNTTGTFKEVILANDGGISASGNITGANANLGNLVTANYFSGDGSLLSNINGGNVSNVANANYANFAGTAYSVDGANVSGTVANANYSAYAGNVVNATQSNIKQTGNLLTWTVNNGIANTNTYQVDPNGVFVTTNYDGWSPPAGTDLTVRWEGPDNPGAGVIASIELIKSEFGGGGDIIQRNFFVEDLAGGSGNAAFFGQETFNVQPVPQGNGGTDPIVAGYYGFNFYTTQSNLADPTGTGTSTQFSVGNPGISLTTGAPLSTSATQATLALVNYGRASTNTGTVGDTANATALLITRNRGNGEVKLSVQANDYIGNIEFRGRRNGTSSPGGSRWPKIAPKIDSSYVTNSANVPAGFEFISCDNTTNYTTSYYANGNWQFPGEVISSGTIQATTGFFKYPVYTASALTAITGQVGWTAAVSDSSGGGNPNGMIAFWDTTHSRWSYIHDNSAV